MTHFHLKRGWLIGDILFELHPQACEPDAANKGHNAPKMRYVHLPDIQLPKHIEVGHAAPEGFCALVPLHIDSQAGQGS